MAVAAILSSTVVAQAVPAFAEQTGMQCSACHVGGFGPQLTPFGRQFKLDGYTMRSGPTFTNPVSAMAVVSFLNTASDQPGPPAPHYGTNNNATVDQVSLFVAGGIGEHFGAFSQFTYDGVGRSFAWDNLDIRATDHVTIDGSDVLLGLGLNNSPSVQDAWNTLPAWGFAYTSSGLAPAPTAEPMLDGALAQGVLGVSAYAWVDSHIYAEGSVYWMPSHGFLRAMGVDPVSDPGRLTGAAPYFRVAYQKDYGDQNFEVGAFGFFAGLYPGGDQSTGTSDHYSDLGADATYQYMGDGTNIYQVNARYLHEQQTLHATQILGGAFNSSDSLNELKLDGSFYWHNIYGGTVAVFDSWGSTDALLYADNAMLRPDSQGLILQVDATPFGNEPSSLGPRVNLRVGIQYILYSRFNGASNNYDGFGRNASDNNTLRIFAWLAL